MNNFKIIYKILKYLEKAMDFAETETEPITFAALHISEERWVNIMTMLLENGYISGVQQIKRYTRSNVVINTFENIKITLKGLEYLSENSMMKKRQKQEAKLSDLLSNKNK